MGNRLIQPSIVAMRVPRLRTDRRGVAAAEFAMVASVLLVFVVAILDIGGSIQQRMVLQQAVRAAGIYAQSFPSQSGAGGNGIAGAVTAALPSTWTDVQQTALLCPGASADPGINCSPSCGGSASGTYMVLQVCRPYKPFLIQTGNCTVAGQSGNCVSYVIKLQ